VSINHLTHDGVLAGELCDTDPMRGYRQDPEENWLELRDYYSMIDEIEREHNEEREVG